MSGAKFTPGPWEITVAAGGLEIRGVAANGTRPRVARVLRADGNDHADAHRIVDCVNAHDELVRHLTEVVTLARHPAVSGSGEWKRMPVELRSAVADAERALAALAKARSPA